ncbi:MAG TPA: hypothetical protein VNJ04_14370 [Gemmatimonadaceae bacterium]|nr:hypothetical protein [Gemmatimonadaceae bacterium]
MTAPVSRRSEGGFTIVELLVSTAIMITVTGAIFSLLNPAQGSGQTQPEVADMQQRLRVGQETLFKELMMAGAGPYQGASTGSLVNFFAPVLPRRTGRVSPDPTQGAASFRSDAITLAYIPNTYSQTTLSAPMPNVSAELKVNNQPNCPQRQQLCGFAVGMNVIIFDTTGYFDTFDVTEVQDAAGHLQHRGQQLNHEYATGSQVTQIVSNTYYLNRVTNQLMRYDGGDAVGNSEVALVDNVVDLAFQYFGDPRPPVRPANCVAGMATLVPEDGSLVALTQAILTDGPYCGSGSNQFDADLLRVRKVRVQLRVQAAMQSLRGTGALFMKPGTALGGERYVPDYRVAFDVSPRNLNLAR